MSSATKRKNLTRAVSEEESDELIDKALAAFGRGEEEVGYSYLAQIPLIPALAEHVLEKWGPEYCEEHFNLYEIKKETGEG